MKKIFCILSIATWLQIVLWIPSALAATTTPPPATAKPKITLTTAPPSAQEAEKLKQIEDLKDRLATKVAQLRQKQKKAIAGNVKTISIASVTIETPTKDIKVDLTDELKVIQYLKGKRTILKTDALAKNDPVVVFGEYDLTLDVMSPKVILIQSPANLLNKTGTIIDIDRTNFTLTLITPENQEIIIDIEKSTRTDNAGTGGLIEKSGFSKLNIGDTIHLLTTLNAKLANRFSARRILNLGNITGAKTPAPTLSPTLEASASAAPKNPAAPKITPKATPTSI